MTIDAAIEPVCVVNTANTHDEHLRSSRARAGQCLGCGAQLYKIKRHKLGFLKRRSITTTTNKPLSIEGQVMRGQCLACMGSFHDHDNEEVLQEAAVMGSRAPEEEDTNNSGTVDFPTKEENNDSSSTTSSESDDASNGSHSSHSRLETPMEHAATIVSIPTDTNNHNESTLVMTSEYIGSFNKYGGRHGEGKLTWSNGDCYEGSFWNEVREGHGTLHFANGGEYVGHWENNKMHGQGTQRFANGDVYTGQYAHGKRSGQGRCYFANGDLYVGSWSGDQLNGHGVYHYNNGQRYEGSFRNNQRNGVGKYQWCDGKIDIYHYVNDVRGGEGVRWSANRKKVWRVVDGKVKKRISLEEASEIMTRLGEQQ